LARPECPPSHKINAAGLAVRAQWRQFGAPLDERQSPGVNLVDLFTWPDDPPDDWGDLIRQGNWVCVGAR
jgi:hypothetical protein